MNIEEMSVKFANDLYSENMADDKWLKARYFYTEGANAVLEEIEKIMLLKYDEVSTYELIEDKIRELKGDKDE